MVKVFIAASLDGYIADQYGSVDFLYQYPEPAGEDMGYYNFMSTIDALVMGRKTFETVLGFGVEWPYTKPVFVWTSHLKSVPKELEPKVQLINGNPKQIISMLNEKNLHNIYVDGAKAIQSFLNEDLIDEMTITTIPSLLGSGIPLFNGISKAVYFEAVESKTYSHGVIQSVFKKVRL